MKAGNARLRIALLLTLGVTILELVGGLAAGSLALLADAAHVFMDAVALGIALAASIGAQMPANERQSYGFARFEILAALGNGGLLFAITILVVLEAVARFHSPELPKGGLMATIAAIAFCINAGIGWSLLHGSREDLNVKAALFHVAGDAIGAAAVVAGGVVIIFTGAAWVDPLLSLLVSAIIIAGVVGIVRESADVLLQSVPPHASIAAVRDRLRLVAGVVDVHDLHIWTIGSGSHVLSAHVLLADKRISEATSILRVIEARLHEDFRIDHVTIQFECESCEPDARIICTQPGRLGLSRGVPGTYGKGET
jgi:cobalt-zinc-cadmium efflux system protein